MDIEDKPSKEWIESAVDSHHFDLNEREIAFVGELIEQLAQLYEDIAALHETTNVDFRRVLQPKQAKSDDDPYNAFVRTFTISGDASGRLSGYQVGVKDNIDVGGIPTTAGSHFLRGFVPQTNAPVVDRILEAGADLVAKTNQTPLSYHDGSVGETSATGPVINPRDSNRTPGGSSSGSAVGVLTGAIDIALGTDQGGSIRGPAAQSGCVGLKPTWSLVPYAGIVPLEDTIDHVGPMAMSVETCAKALDAIAGAHPADHRQAGVPEGKVGGYEDSLDGDVDGLNIGVLQESIEADVVDEEVRTQFEMAMDWYESNGATIEYISIPMAEEGEKIWSALAIEGIAKNFDSNMLTHGTMARRDPVRPVQFGGAKQVRADQIQLPLKATILAGEYQFEQRQGESYVRAMNLAYRLRESYANQFNEVDIIATPTLPTLARKIPEAPTVNDIISNIARSPSSTTTLAQFNLTGHPAISLPCGMVDGLPVGLQLVGPLWADAKLLKAAYQYELESNPELFSTYP